MARFDPDVVHKCALECLGKPKPEMFEAFAKALAAHYPNVLDFSQPWIYSIAGGAMILAAGVLVVLLGQAEVEPVA